MYPSFLIKSFIITKIKIFISSENTYAMRNFVPSLCTKYSHEIPFEVFGCRVLAFGHSPRPAPVHLYSEHPAFGTRLFCTAHVHSQRAIGTWLVNCIRFRHINCCQLPLTATTSPPLTTSVSRYSQPPPIMVFTNPFPWRSYTTVWLALTWEHTAEPCRLSFFRCGSFLCGYCAFFFKFGNINSNSIYF